MGYTVKKHIQILIAMLKEYNIRKVIISPGATNVVFVGSVQSDDWFEIYSAPDERSAAYMACGLADESGEAVALSCTGATASRNYMPGLTEAFYRKLPVLAITSGITPALPYNNTPQVLDRSILPNDIANGSVVVSDIYSDDDYWKCALNINKAILALSANGGGPAHIQLLSESNLDFSVQTLPDVNIIKRYTIDDILPDIDSASRIAVRVGAHKYWDKQLTALVDAFCERYNAVVLCDHSSGYHGKYRILEALIGGQEALDAGKAALDLLIDIGDITANYFVIPVKNVWRISSDGKISDRYRKLSKVFAMSEERFFQAYIDKMDRESQISMYNEFYGLYNELVGNIPILPFSNVWIAQQLHDKMPENSYLHLGILNSIRAWNFFEINPSIHSTANTGGFGIDGALSTTLGASLADKEKVCFCILGDLAFFYDMNVLGNRHIGKNIRILLINNGIGTEFKNYWHPGAMFGTRTNDFIAAGGHYGNKSRNLVRHYAEDLGFEYMSAANKEEFTAVCKNFLGADIGDKPIVFEVFTDHDEESEALKLIRNILKGNLK
ncbi:MAG: 2-succinyl-5-enolpyruvyl-6-hydroxy-3-cyclohexene-1-carboxylate synthase, partial [Selenomonadaceae bacterium]|nr:2-succinyl-5-enolpyruvyl-6-hydroxy-3-cyclohexene-1-carboxylate synthase [Selenomonadaceae bacterium]